ncbi:uncharacterized protein ALTATR162_LOCUS2702 [Alternaria atra]|uniref:Chitin-binding type-1 domain-containing protein n=1 Tax=Alternaria atra TaxID=119953 RepID=A0A8J2N3J3_9PLEO|nr:uncharacterized protein ALTATR162_LOCUS2702 [Alternaria atra]CAG5150567.1 unnamed protein product [Alternaria atra]
MKSIHLLLFSLLGFFSLIPLVFVPLVSGHNMVKFINHCPYNIFFWQVGPASTDPTKQIDGSDKYRNMVPGNGGSVIHNMRDTEALGGGLSLKIRDLPYYAVAPAGIIQVEYHLEQSTGAMWYDLSAVDCNLMVGPEDAMYCPLIQGGIRLYVPEIPDDNCPPANCNETGCFNAYTKEGGYPGEPSWKCRAGADLFLETCTEKAGERTFYGVDPKAPVPVHQGIPEPVARPPVSLTELNISPNGKCGPDVGFTCSGSQHGVCCSEYGYCGNRPEYCSAGCQPIFGYCLGENEAHPQVAAPAPLVLTTVTATSVLTQTTTATKTETVTRAVRVVTVTVLKTVGTTAVFTPPPVSITSAVSTRYYGKMFTGYPRMYAAAYVDM